MSSSTAEHTTAVDRVYAAALLELGEDQNALDAIADEVDQLAALLTDSPDLRRLLATRTLTTSDLAGVIDRTFKGRVSDTVYRFLHVVNGKGRLPNLEGILRAFDQLLEQKRGIVEADIYVATRLSDAEAKQVADRLGAAIGKQVALHQYVDESLIGGVKIRLGDEMIDGSVATQLKQMKKQLIEEGREKARRISHEP